MFSKNISEFLLSPRGLEESSSEDEVEDEVENEVEDEVEDEVEEKRTKIKRFDSVVKQIKVIKNFLITEITKPKNKIILELVFILLLIKYFV